MKIICICIFYDGFLKWYNFFIFLDMNYKDNFDWIIFNVKFIYIRKGNKSVYLLFDNSNCV